MQNPRKGEKAKVKMNNEKTMTMKQLKRELDDRFLDIKSDRASISALMHEIIQRLNRRELTYTNDRMLKTKSTLFASIYTYDDYPEMIGKWEVEITIDYSSLHSDEYEDFENFFFPKLPEGWMVTRRECDPACCSVSFYITRNRDWVLRNERVEC